jgi:hypothetical protein
MQRSERSTAGKHRPLHWIPRSILFVAALGVAAIASGCISTSWKHTETYPRSVQTVLVATSNPPAEVFLNGESVGQTPLRLPLYYDSMVQRSQRDVTLWMAQPGLAVALTVLTAGGYLPSSLFPVRTENRTEIRGYSNNSYRVRLEAPGLPAWDSSVQLEGQPEHDLDVDLQALATPLDPDATP